MKHYRVFPLFLFSSLALLLVRQAMFAQGLGPITQIHISDGSLVLHADSAIVVFRACTDNILMVNFRPSGIEDHDTLVVATTNWLPTGALIDTSGNPIRMSTLSFTVEIDRTPLRFRLHGTSVNAGMRLMCEEPAAGGIGQNKITLETTGGTFYGVHNRTQGTLTTPAGGSVYAGSQGQAGAPFAWTTSGWGFLADADGGEISIGANSFTFEQPASGAQRDLEFYLLVGTPKGIIRGFHEITGFPPLFPKYTLGFMNTEWGIDQTELYRDIRTYRQKSIPLDAYVLDFDWMDWGADDYGEFRWGPKFPDGQSGAIVDTLRESGMHLMGIRKPRVHVNTAQGQYGQARGFFTDFVTDYFSGMTVGRVNFHLPAARAWYFESFAVRSGSYAKGITGYWNDEADDYGGNMMFMQMQRAQYEGQRALNNQRVWSINRNYYAGAHRYAYGLWSGDIQTGFPAMAEQRLFMLSSITLGVSWWGMDIGGFANAPSPENYYRWMQFGAFVPLFRVHGTYNQEREPWNFGAQAESIATASIRLRYRLLPYIYSAAWENHLTGLSIVRPLVIEYPDDPATENLSSEWMFGNSLLVSPVVQSGATHQSVYLPGGNWLDFHHGQHYPGGTSYDVPLTPDEIPLFVKSGSIIPMSPTAQFVDDSAMTGTIILGSYPGGSGQCTVYDDDGISYDYESGNYSTMAISHDRDDERVLISIAAPDGMYIPPHRDWLCELHWTRESPDTVLLDGIPLAMRSPDSLRAHSVSGWAFDETSRQCIVRFPDDRAPHSLAINFAPSSSGAVDDSRVPRENTLGQNYPNPFNPLTRIEFGLKSGGEASLAVYDLLGRRVSTLMDETKAPGRYAVTFHADRLASGVYFYRLQAGSFSQTRKMIFVR